MKKTLVRKRKMTLAQKRKIDISKKLGAMIFDQKTLDQITLD